MRRLWGLLVAGLLVATCGPSPAQIETAIAQTAVSVTATHAALPTPTLAPTATPVPTATPALSPEVAARVQRFLEQGTQVSVLTEQGVVFVDFRAAVGEVAGTFDLLDRTWPSHWPRRVRNDAADAVEGWQLALELWSLDIGNKDNPVEPNINGWMDFYRYGGDDLVVRRHPANFIVDEYAGKQFLPFDENVSILMGLGSDYFESARDGLLRLVE